MVKWESQTDKFNKNVAEWGRANWHTEIIDVNLLKQRSNISVWFSMGNLLKLFTIFGFA